MAQNIGKIMKQAQKMQQKMMEMQEELASKTVEASAGGGMVTAVVNGKNELVSYRNAAGPDCGCRERRYQKSAGYGPGRNGKDNGRS